MSIMILHGEHEKASRQALFEQMKLSQDAGQEIVRLESSEITVPELESHLGNSTLFGGFKAIFIEGLHSLPKSKKKDACINLIANSTADVNSILWERKKLTPAQLQKFKHAKVHEFSLPKTIFAWLDHLQAPTVKQVQLFHKALEQEEVEFCFLMLVRQVRLLLQTKSGVVVKEHPFVIKKLQAQAKHFTLEQLVEFHEQLTFIDYHYKTGQLKQSLQEALEQLILLE